jgi:hypothetical protein
MATNTSYLDQSNKNIFSLYADSFMDTCKALAYVSTSSAQLSIILSNTFAQPIQYILTQFLNTTGLGRIYLS